MKNIPSGVLMGEPRSKSPEEAVISFYLAPWLWPEGGDDIPDDWAGHGWSHGCWVVRTYRELSARGLPCVLTKVPPRSGIVITYRNCLPLGLLRSYWSWTFPRRDRLVVCARGDRARHHWAQVHLSQNQLQADRENRLWLPEILRQKGRTHFVPHWPLDRLRPREATRGSRVENVVFFGNRSQVARELLQPEWEQFLASLGMRWRIVNDIRHCRDYSDVDVVIAIRDFSRRLHLRKPSWKILNAWFADALVITSMESSSRELRNSKYDFLEVSSYQELLHIMEKLATGQIDYQRYVACGSQRREAYSSEQMAKRWLTLIEDELRPAFYCWQSSGRIRRWWFILIRSLEWAVLSAVGVITYLLFTWKRIRH